MLNTQDLYQIARSSDTKKCCPPGIDLEWYDEYTRIRKLMQKHGIQTIDQN